MSSKQGGKDLAVAANFHFIFPFLSRRAFALGAVYEPAEMSGLKLPGGTSLFVLAFFSYPAVLAALGILPALVDEQKIGLSFNMKRHRPPSLFVALNGL